MLLIHNPEDNSNLPSGIDWRLTKPVGYNLTVTGTPKDATYGPARPIKIRWMTINEWQHWLDEDLKKEMKDKGADANAYEAVRKALVNRHASETHNYDYAIIFAPTKSK